MFKTLGDYSQSLLACHPEFYTEEMEGGGNLLVRRYRKNKNKKLKKKFKGGVGNGITNFNTRLFNTNSDKANLFITGDKICGVIACYNEFENIKKNSMIFYSSPNYNFIYDNNKELYIGKNIKDIIINNYSKYNNFLKNISFEKDKCKLYFSLTNVLKYFYYSDDINPGVELNVSFIYFDTELSQSELPLSELPQQESEINGYYNITFDSHSYDTMIIEININEYNSDSDKITNDNFNKNMKNLNSIKNKIDNIISNYILILNKDKNL